MKRVYTQNIARSPQDAPGGYREAKPGKVYPKGCKDASQGVLVARFEIPYPPTKKGLTAWNKRFSVNAYYAGKHYQQRRRDAKELHRLAVLSMRAAKIPKRMISEPVEIRFLWDDRLDADNHAVMGKAFVDSMKGYILQDDSRRWVKKVSHEFWDAKKIGVEIRTYREVSIRGIDCHR